jgi:hypothetical protein
LSIEFSFIDALNEDIVNIMATLDVIENLIGDHVLQYSPDYPGLYHLRQVYFNRLTEDLNFKAFFEYFKWFDTTFGSFLDQLIPDVTNYLGSNFVIESHMLERNKIEYNNPDIYLKDINRPPGRGNVPFSNFEGKIKLI